MGCGTGFIKYLLFFFNLVFALLGLTILVIGIVNLLNVNKMSSFLEGKITTPPIIFIVIGSIVFVVAFLGCCGAIRENHCMIILFAVCLFVLLVTMIAVGALALIYGKQAENVLDDVVNKTFVDAGDTYELAGNDTAAAVVKNTQTLLECCGSNGPSYYQSDLVPASCCKAQDGKPCGPRTNSALVYQMGCTQALHDAVKKLGIVIGGVAIAVAVLEIVGIIFALCLANSIVQENRRGVM